jgi:threonyl-tRNA synthetase
VERASLRLTRGKNVLAGLSREAIKITLPDGKVVEGVAFETTPLSVALDISKSLAKRTCVARVSYSRRVGVVDESIVHAEEEGDDDDVPDYSHLLSEEEVSAAAAGGATTELWDLTRPFEGDCTVALLGFDTEEGRSTFWHSSAHVLGASIEEEFGGQLTMGPPTQDGFYYDAYLGSMSIKQSDLELLNKRAASISKAKLEFERLVLSKEQALRLFADNPFKVQIIRNKIPDGSSTTAYRCGRLVDLCTGPHLPDTARIGALSCQRNSAAFWLGNVANDALGRVTAVAFPDKKQLNKHLKALEAAKKFDHRTIGSEQELFFFHDLSPGSAFFLPHGARIYKRLQELVRSEYWKRGFEEAITPNVFNLELWRQSGHAKHYLDDMFTFDVEDAKFGLKPMNCPGHCLLFKHRIRSFRELPLRIADFGALHRNEASGALTGLTRVRRFQQDDGHIFCREDQIEAEVEGALDFMANIYEKLGFEFELDLSTRPKKAMGDPALWVRAELMMKSALVRFGRKWQINPGDGAFYGPKIDVKVYDVFGRRHQCATIQLDFQLPLRFDLKYQKGGVVSEASADGTSSGWKKDKKKNDKAAAKAAKKAAKAAANAAAQAAAAASEGGDAKEAAAEPAAEPAPVAAAAAEAAPAKGSLTDPVVTGTAATADDAASAAASGAGASDAAGGAEDEEEDKYANPPPLGEMFARPVIVHRAVLGSVERMFAVLTEHLKGKWPMWLSPRQVMVVPIHAEFLPHCETVLARLRAQGVYAELDSSTRTLNKKIREAQVQQFNLILVVGKKESESDSVAVRSRDNTDHGIISTAMALNRIKAMRDDRVDDWAEAGLRAGEPAPEPEPPAEATAAAEDTPAEATAAAEDTPAEAAE